VVASGKRHGASRQKRSQDWIENFRAHEIVALKIPARAADASGYEDSAVKEECLGVTVPGPVHISGSCERPGWLRLRNRRKDEESGRYGETHASGSHFKFLLNTALNRPLATLCEDASAAERSLPKFPGELWLS
jgi:hypothetical protein